MPWQKKMNQRIAKAKLDAKKREGNVEYLFQVFLPSQNCHILLDSILHLHLQLAPPNEGIRSFSPSCAFPIHFSSSNAPLTPFTSSCAPPIGSFNFSWAPPAPLNSSWTPLVNKFNFPNAPQVPFNSSSTPLVEKFSSTSASPAPMSSSWSPLVEKFSSLGAQPTPFSSLVSLTRLEAQSQWAHQISCGQREHSDF